MAAFPFLPCQHHLRALGFEDDVYNCILDTIRMGPPLPPQH